MVVLRHSWMSGPARPWRAVFACLVALVLALSIVASGSSASASPLHSDGVLPLSSQLAPGEPGSDDTSGVGILLHAHCGCHQVMRAEPVAFEPARIADRIVYSIQVEPVASRPAPPLRRPPRA